jgi:RNA recognition motif-containing protein
MRQAGDVTFAEVMQEADGRSKGCGIVEFANNGAAQQAISTLNDSDLKGRMIFVREDRENRQSTGSSNNCSVYVGNLHFDVSWQDLKDHMRATGNVDQADILTGEDGRSKGCGVVTYQNPQGANRAIRELQNR